MLSQVKALSNPFWILDSGFLQQKTLAAWARAVLSITGDTRLIEAPHSRAFSRTVWLIQRFYRRTQAQEQHGPVCLLTVSPKL